MSGHLCVCSKVLLSDTEEGLWRITPSSVGCGIANPKVGFALWGEDCPARLLVNEC